MVRDHIVFIKSASAITKEHCKIANKIKIFIGLMRSGKHFKSVKYLLCKSDKKYLKPVNWTVTRHATAVQSFIVGYQIYFCDYCRHKLFKGTATMHN